MNVFMIFTILPMFYFLVKLVFLKFPAFIWVAYRLCHCDLHNCRLDQVQWYSSEANRSKGGFPVLFVKYSCQVVIRYQYLLCCLKMVKNEHLDLAGRKKDFRPCWLCCCLCASYIWHLLVESQGWAFPPTSHDST